MSLKKLLLDKIISTLEKTLQTDAEDKKENLLVTEEDILRAINALPKATPTIKKPTSNVLTGYNKNDNMVKVEKPKMWSLFKYIGKPEYHGLSKVSKDSRFYFTIPCGWEWEEGSKYWFLTLPLGGDIKEIIEFFTLSDPSM